MNKPRNYHGYCAFQYLHDDIDGVDIHDELYYGEPYEIPLDDEQEERVASLANRKSIISLHDHPVHLPANVEEYPEYTESGWMKTAYEGLAESVLDAVFVAPFGVRKLDEAIDTIGKCYADVAQQDFVVQAGSVEDIHRAKERGQVAFVPCIETSMPIENDLERLDALFGLGVRSLGITYSESNALGTGLAESFPGGLTEFGKEAVERMNKLGILIDTSHASDQTTIDTCEASDDPIILSHNGAKELLDIERLDPDKVLKTVADTSGLIGIQAAPHTSASLENPRHSIESMMDHFEYVVDLVGIDHVTFGPDVNYGDHFGLHQVFGKDMSEFPDPIRTDIDYTKGMDNPTEAWDNILRWLVKEGYSDEEIAKVAGGNTLRVLQEVWP